MTTTAAYPATMTELRGEPAHSALWPSYGSSLNVSSRVETTGEPVISNPVASSPHMARPRTDHNSLDHAQLSYGRYAQDEPHHYAPHHPSGIAASHGYPSLKRSYSQSETPAYQEIVQDLRDDSSRMNMSQDHKLLAFRKTQDKHTITDQHGRVQSLELSAQLHGMFFLSEMPPNPSESTSQQPELTCYRRNLFQISGSLVTPRGSLSVVTESGESVPVNTMEVTISAIESVDGNPVRLIVIPWKTPPPNTTEVSQSPDQEPPSLPLIPFQDDGSDTDGDYAIYPIGWRRLQFRIATANNGRRKELQQHFVLHLKVHGTLANGTKVVMTESTTAPIVVRGRSPRNFQARKEIPLLGSSAGSRGQALVESGLGVVAGSLGVKQQEVKTRGVEAQIPRSAFTFTAPKVPSGPGNPLRSSTYPSWAQSGQGTVPHIPSSSPGPYPAATLPTDPYGKGPLTGNSNFSNESSEIPMQQSIGSLPIGVVASDQQATKSPYPYGHSSATSRQVHSHSHSLSGGEPSLGLSRFADSERAMKSPRTAGQPSIHAPASVGSQETQPDYRYGSYASIGGASDVQTPNYATDPPSTSAAPPREYYPSVSTWSTSAGENTSAASYTAGDARPYAYPPESYKPGQTPSATVKTELGATQPPSNYHNTPRGSFVDALNNYSWGSN